MEDRPEDRTRSDCANPDDLRDDWGLAKWLFGTLGAAILPFVITWAFRLTEESRHHSSPWHLSVLLLATLCGAACLLLTPVDRRYLWIAAPLYCVLMGLILIANMFIFVCDRFSACL